MRVAGKQVGIYVIVFLVVQFPAVCSAQIDFRPGYIVKSGNDTIKGLVAYRADKLNLENCLFKTKKKEKAQSLSPIEIEAYSFENGKTYEVITLPKGYPNPPDGKVFVKTLVKGAFTLYQYKDYFCLKTPDSLFTLPFPKETVEEREEDNNQFILPTTIPAPSTVKRKYVKVNRKYVGILNYLMLDCKIDPSKAAYTEGDLTRVVYKYNLCKATVPTSKNVSPLGRIDFQLFSGYLSSNLLYDYQNKKIPFSSNTILGAAGIELSSPRIFDKLFFSVEGWMVKAFYQGYYEGKLTGDPIKQDILMDISYVKLPFGVKYNFKGVGSTPYVRAGAYWSYVLSSSIKTIQEKEVLGTIYTDQFMDEYQIKNPKGIWLSLGYDKKLYKGAGIFGEVRLERGEGYIGSPVVNLSRLTNLNFLVGFRF